MVSVQNARTPADTMSIGAGDDDSPNYPRSTAGSHSVSAGKRDQDRHAHELRPEERQHAKEGPAHRHVRRLGRDDEDVHAHGGA